MHIKKKKRGATRTRFSPVMIVMLVVLVLYVISLIVPFVWGFFTSFKHYLDFINDPVGLPKEWVWNYGTVIQKYYIAVTNDKIGTELVYLDRMYINSLLYAVGSAIVAGIVPCITAYLCARFRNKFSGLLYSIAIVTMILPIVGNMPSQIIVSRTLGLYDHIWGMWIMNASYLGLYFLVFYNVFRALPKDFTEAAKIDGAGNVAILFRIVLPVVRNTLFTVILIKFIDFWNDYQTPLIYLPSSPTTAYGLYWMSKTTENGMNSVPMRLAASMMIFIPILIIFLLLQKRLLGNLMVGGIKG